MSLIQLQTRKASIAAVDRLAFERALADAIEGEVRFDKISCALYSTDASVYQIIPFGVVIPKTRKDVERTLEVCRRFCCPFTLRGGGTSQAGQAIGEGLQIDLSKYFNRVLEVNVAQLWVRVEPGIVLDELNAVLAPHGLRFAPDISTASRATIGGMMANNSSGARSVLYGKTIDHVLEQTVLLSDGSVVNFRDLPREQVPTGASLEAFCYSTVLTLAGRHAAEIDKRYPKILRRVGGYNLDEFADATRPVNLVKMMVGSEGTLGTVLEAKLRLVHLPKATAVMVIEFATLLEALAATPSILLHKPSAIEVMDKAILDNTRQNADLEKVRASIITGDPGATLCVEFHASQKEHLPPRLVALEEDLRAHNFGYRYHTETDPQAQKRIWGLREAALGLSMAVKNDAKSISFVEDTAVAPEKLSEFIGRFLALLKNHGTTAGIYAHASVGCLHVRPVVNMKTEDGVRQFEAIANDVAALVLEFGGALSGEHGDGLVRGPFMRQMFGPVLYEAFREIKRAFDPEGLLNPGKIVDSPPLTSNLRYGAQYKATNPQTWFDYSDYGGMSGAVEMCSGVGACRKTLAGTMCPSYMATKEESASTRGRANILRLAMSGELGEDGFTSEGVYQALDLCLECRACKTECPVGVDVARFKSEFLSHYWARHGTPLRTRVLGGVAQMARWGSRLAPLSNWLAASAPVRYLNEALFDIDSRRTLPAWKQETLAKWLSRNPRLKSTRQVSLFNDTFINHYDPQIGVAAIEILEHAGFQVNVVRPGCCGRPLISQGLLEDARLHASSLIAALLPIAQRGEPLLFLEPSCLSAVKEDIPSLVRGDLQKSALIVASAAQLFEEFAATLDLVLKPGPTRVLLHGHCHQKSIGLVPAAVALLKKIPGAIVVDLDAGCCGMAGSFGYTKGHYDVSKAIAARRLLPALAAMEPGDVAVAAGTSCRHQIEDLSNQHAMHPAVLIRDLLKR